jgi:pantetheine-phosphate adenylyltransferase
MTTKVAVYAGHFDPFTLGHMNIVRRAEKVFERVIVAVAEDSPKKAMFSVEEREGILKELFKDSKTVEVDRFNGLLIGYLRRKEVSILIRGIRTVSDFEYEYQMALANKTLDAEIETFFMMTEGDYSYLSSSVIKEIARLGGDISRMVPKEVVRHVLEKYANQ